MFDIYFAPGRAFARLKEKPSWLVPLILVLVFKPSGLLGEQTPERD